MIDFRLLKLIGKASQTIYLMTVLNTLGMILNIIITALICFMLYNGMSPGTELYKLCFLSLTILLAAGMRFFLGVQNEKLKSKLSTKVKRDLRQEVYTKTLKIALREHPDYKSASITQMSLEGIEQLDRWYTLYLPQFLFAFVAPFLLFSIILFIEPRTAWALLLSIPLIPLSILAVSRYAKRVFSKYWGIYLSMGDLFLDNLQGLRELKIFSADQLAQEKMNRSAEEFRRITMKVLVMQLSSIAIMDFVAFGGAGLAIVLTLQSGIQGNISTIKVLFLILLSAEFFLPLRALGSAFHIAMNGVSAGKKILTFLDLPEETWGKEECPQIRQISVESLSFSYGKRVILEDLSMNFSLGLWGIAGESGSGKSTLISLLLGSLEPDRGSVTVEGMANRTFERASFFSRVAFMGCHSHIFCGSIRDNFYLSCPDLEEKQMIEALEKVGLIEFARNSRGLDFQISEEGKNLSGGQKQRLVLAINLVSDKDVFILDEAFSNLDKESEEMVMRSIHHLARTKIVILVSHKLKNLVKCKRIFILSKGVKVKEGTHEELCLQGGDYASLYQKQIEWEKTVQSSKNSVKRNLLVYA